MYEVACFFLKIFFYKMQQLVNAIQRKRYHWHTYDIMPFSSCASETTAPNAKICVHKLNEYAFYIKVQKAEIFEGFQPIRFPEPNITQIIHPLLPVGPKSSKNVVELNREVLPPTR